MSSFTISPSEGPGIYAKALGAAIFGHVDQVYRELRRLEQERRYDEAYQRKKVLGAEITKICCADGRSYGERQDLDSLKMRDLPGDSSLVHFLSRCALPPLILSFIAKHRR
jgi:hypothetical protein